MVNVWSDQSQSPADLWCAEKQGATVPRMIGHRLMGSSLMATGDIAESQVHDDKALALYDPAEHRPLATRFGQDVSVVILSYRSWTRWLLGYPEAALADTDHALKNAREMGQSSTLIYALSHASFTHIFCGNYTAVNAQLDEAVTLADEKSALAWKAFGSDNYSVRCWSSTVKASKCSL